MATDEPVPDDPRSDRVSLAGPDPLDVLRALLKVDPDALPADSAQSDDGHADVAVDPARREQ